MAGNGITISTDQVAQIATSIESLNKKLTQTLEESKATVAGLAKIWEGEAAQATISSFNEFAKKYFQTYEDVITQYVKFLRVNVDQGYTAVEEVNISLADSFK